jgi:hypothetical protein
MVTVVAEGVPSVPPSGALSCTWKLSLVSTSASLLILILRVLVLASLTPQLSVPLAAVKSLPACALPATVA